MNTWMHSIWFGIIIGLLLSVQDSLHEVVKLLQAAHP